jgi:hypothetical protein
MAAPLSAPLHVRARVYEVPPVLCRELLQPCDRQLARVARDDPLTAAPFTTPASAPFCVSGTRLSSLSGLIVVLSWEEAAQLLPGPAARGPFVFG